MRLRVLVVDDEPLAREGLKLLLGRQPQVESVSEARNGREAVALISEQKPDLVLLDVQMPRTDGFAVVHAIGAERMPPVIFVTAHIGQWELSSQLASHGLRRPVHVVREEEMDPEAQRFIAGESTAATLTNRPKRRRRALNSAPALVAPA